MTADSGHEQGGLPAAGWYRDPSSSNMMRYWDGQRWTEHLHPVDAPATVGPAAPAPRQDAVAVQSPATFRPDPRIAFPAQVQGQAPRRTAPAPSPHRYLWMKIVAGVVAVPLLLIEGATVASSDSWKLSQWNAVTKDSHYAYTANMHVGADQLLNVPMRSDQNAVDTFDMYSDAALTSKVGFEDAALTPPLSSLPGDVASNRKDGYAALYGSDSGLTPRCDARHGSASEEEGECNDKIQHVVSKDSNWPLLQTFWLVRVLDMDGKKLARPIVTKVIVDPLNGQPTTPEFSVGHDDDGTVTVHWSKVPGATSYRILYWDQDLSKSTDDRAIHDERLGDFKVEGSPQEDGAVIAESTGTSWKASHFRDVTEGDWQNAELRMDQIGSQDYATTDFNAGQGKYRYHLCVVATNGTSFSGCKDQDVTTKIGTMPYHWALDAADVQYRDYRGSNGFLTVIPTKFPFTALNGSTRSVPAKIDPASLRVDAQGVNWADFHGVGTELAFKWGDRTTFTATDIAAFNTRSMAQVSRSGTATVDVSTAEGDLGQGSKVAPPTTLPVFGSSPMVKYIAQQMIGHATLIDVSDYLDKPGAPELDDALNEALAQNPYILFGEIKGLGTSGSVVQVTYTISLVDQRKIQQQVSDKVNQVVAQVTNASMSAAQKVTAVNSWIAANGTYDYPAYNALLAGGGKTLAAGTEAAFSPEGILLKGTGVCKSYADAFKLLASAAGVETVEVTGIVNYYGSAHAWDKVKVDGVWKAVDPTWNDGPPDNQYLMINDSQFTGDATRSQDEDWMVDNLISSYNTP